MVSPPRLAWLAVSLVATLGACRRDVSRLDEVQKMAYSVKPAVVRISAYATARFRYQPEAIRAIEERLKDDGFGFTAVNLPAGEGEAATGAGGSGSGFIIHPDGWILTSGHVVAPTRDATALHRELLRNGAIAALVHHFPVDQLRTLYRADVLEKYVSMLEAGGRLERVEVFNDVELSNGERLPFRVDQYSPALDQRGTDVALLKVDRHNLPVLDLGDSDVTRVGQSIWSVGYPAVASSSDDVIGGWLSRDSDLEATFNPGTITAIKRNVANTPVFQSNVAIYRGNSGGPAVNRDGEVIGISTWGRADAEQIKFLVPINIARDVLTTAGVTANIEGSFNTHYRGALDAAYDGNWSLADRELTSASRFFRNSPDLIRFQRDTQRALKEAPLWQQHRLLTIVAATALILGIVTCLILLVRARRERRFPLDMDRVSTVETFVAPGRAEPGERRSTILGRLTILNGSRAGERLGLGGSGIRIGRESTICEIVLENPKVSRLHAEVVSIDGKVLLIDRNSSNGTFVNDQKIDKRFLKDGDIIYFGGRNAVAMAFHA